MSKPREVIARALHRADADTRRFDPHWNAHEWDDLSDPAKVYWNLLADAAIDAMAEPVEPVARLAELLESARGQNARLIEENKRLRDALSAGWSEK